MDFFECATGTEPSHGINERVKLGKEEGAEVVLFGEETFGAAFVDRSLWGEGLRIYQEFTELLEELPALKLIFRESWSRLSK